MHFNGTIDTFLQVTINTPTYTYAYKYAAIDGIRKLDNFKKQKQDFHYIKGKENDHHKFPRYLKFEGHCGCVENITNSV